MKVKKRIKIIDDGVFVTKNFEKLVNKYGGKTVILCNGEIFSNTKEAEAKYPKLIPMILTLPSPEFFTHHFIL